MAAYQAAHPYASAVELAEVRAAERGKDPHTVPYFDLTVSAVKSVSVLHASYRVSARQARERGDEEQAAALDARADEIENALMESAREAAAWLERHATYTRIGHHSARTGEWRDGDGLVASLFLHHLSRDGDPQLHVHVAIWNRVQRADKADEKVADPGLAHPAQPAARRGPGRRPDPGDQAGRARLCHGAPGGRQRRRGRRGQPGRHGPVQLPRRRRHRRAGPARPGVPGQARQAAVPPHAVAAAPAGRAEHPPHQGRGPPHYRRADRHRRTHRGAAARRLGSTDRAPRSACPVRGARASRPVRRRQRAARAPAVLDDAAKRTAARIAVAEVQKQHAVWSMAQLRFEVHRALPVLKPGADGEAVVTEVAKLAVSGRAGTEVVQVTAPDITDVTSLGVRASDGGSIYRPPNEERYCTLAHLDTEEQILAAAKRTVPQLVSDDAGAGGRRAHRAERRAARRRGDDAHRGRGDDGADRPGRGGQEPHHGRVRPAVDHASPAGGSSA